MEKLICGLINKNNILEIIWLTLKETFCFPLEVQEHFNCVCLLIWEIISMDGALRKEINSGFAQWSSFVFSF